LASKLDDLAIQRSQYIPRNQVMAVPDDPEDAGVYLQNISLYDLALYFKRAMESKPVIQSYELQREPISLDHQKAIILANFDKNGKLYFSRLMKKIETKLEAIVTFLAILELMRLSQIEIKQTKLFGEIILLLKSKDSISNS
jgi:segregation and condensation protein A